MYQWLDNALDYGISEADFWNMTIAELNRAIRSKKRMMKLEAQEKATYDYIMADLIGQSVARIYSSSVSFPEIHNVYPTIFDREKIEEQKQRQRDEISVQNMKNFAESFNKNFKKKKEVAKDNERAT